MRTSSPTACPRRPGSGTAPEQERRAPGYYHWAWIHIGSNRHLLIRRNRSTSELAFYLCRSPTAVTLWELVRVAGARWSVEECFQTAKSQVGLDHYQVRTWTSWHRHITLAMLALAFLTTVAASTNPDRPANPHHPARNSNTISLTVPEIRHLLTATFEQPPTTAARLLHWSTWRRRHQTTSQRSHYQRRSTEEHAG